MTTETMSTEPSVLKKLFYRPPFIGLLAFILVFVVQGLGHTLMVAMEHLLGDDHVIAAATLLGAIGAVMLFVGMKYFDEVVGTWLGFWAGTLLWTGWVEFAFIWNANLLGVPDLLASGELMVNADMNVVDIATKAEYRVMMSSIGLLAATMCYFVLNKETKCNFFHWFQRRLKLSTGKPTPKYPRNFAAITCLETIYVLWFCYLMLLFIYEIIGDQHPITYGIFFANTAWAIYLLQRLVRFWKVTTAVRYAIPTAIIAYSSWELLERWGVIKDFWVRPMDFALPLGLLTGALVVAALFAARTPKNVKSLAKS